MLNSFRTLGAIGIISVVVLAVSTPITRSNLTDSSKMQQNSESHTQWLARTLKEIQSVKVGMTRRQLLTIFTTEGGISTRTTRKYVYRGSPYIKVDVEFEPMDPVDRRESPDDKIISISRPYLENPIAD